MCNGKGNKIKLKDSMRKNIFANFIYLAKITNSNISKSKENFVDLSTELTYWTILKLM